jgi:hypothetical protein
MLLHFHFLCCLIPLQGEQYCHHYEVLIHFVSHLHQSPVPHLELSPGLFTSRTFCSGSIRSLQELQLQFTHPNCHSVHFLSRYQTFPCYHLLHYGWIHILCYHLIYCLIYCLIYYH